MSKKRIISAIMAFALIFSCFATIASADAPETMTEIYADDEIVILANADISDHAKDVIISDLTGAPATAAEARGLTCTLFGHKLTTSTVQKITHKARTTVPRCLEETYDYDVCSRCDYSLYTLVSSKYIYCCAAD